VTRAHEQEIDRLAGESLAVAGQRSREVVDEEESGGERDLADDRSLRSASSSTVQGHSSCSQGPTGASVTCPSPPSSRWTPASSSSVETASASSTMEDDRPSAAQVDMEEAEEDALPDWSRFASFAK